MLHVPGGRRRDIRSRSLVGLVVDPRLRGADGATGNLAIREAATTPGLT